MSLSDTMEEMDDLLNGLSKDLTKVAKGNRAAAQRVRVNTLNLEKVGKQFRKLSVASEKKAAKRKR